MSERTFSNRTCHMFLSIMPHKNKRHFVGQNSPTEHIRPIRDPLRDCGVRSEKYQTADDAPGDGLPRSGRPSRAKRTPWRPRRAPRAPDHAGILLPSAVRVGTGSSSTRGHLTVFGSGEVRARPAAGTGERSSRRGRRPATGRISQPFAAFAANTAFDLS